MSNKSEIKRLWIENFDDTRLWVDMFFDRVYDDSQAMVMEADGRIVSSLLLQRYNIMFHGRPMPMAYIMGASTKRQARGRGYMSRLMADALRQSRERGDMMCSLIPAHEWLYFFYDRFGFNTVFYVDIQRFTSLHAFAGDGKYRQVDNPFDEKVYEAMHRMEQLREGSVLHSHRDFLNIMDDLNMEPDTKFVVMESSLGEICSMAWAVRHDNVVEVRELLAVDHPAELAALRALRAAYPDSPFRVLAAAASGTKRRLHARGMGRIVNVGLCLEAIAAGHPELTITVRVTDTLLPENSHTYAVANGKVTVDDNTARRPDLDVDIQTFNAIVFSSKQMGDIIGLPSHQAHMSLMLD